MKMIIILCCLHLPESHCTQLILIYYAEIYMPSRSIVYSAKKCRSTVIQTPEIFIHFSIGLSTTEL